MKKYGYWLICTAFFLAILLLCAVKTEVSTVVEYPLAFCIEQDAGDVEIAIHESDDGNWYVFLPSYTELSELRIVMPAEPEASLGGIPIADGMGCDAFRLDEEYSLNVSGQYIAQLQFCQSANVATLHVDTVTGTMDRVNSDKKYSEEASVKLYTADGILDLSDASAYIKGRGNATWYYGKRPYILTLSAAADALGMGAATKWILLANAQDATNLNNKLILDLAAQTGSGWAPESRYVDVYLNGQYNGLYLLTEKVEVGDSRLPIDPQSGDFLCKVDLEKRKSSLIHPVTTQSGRTVEISSPDPLSEESRESILAAVNRMEQSILSDADLAAAEGFDLDSWVQRYLLDEISGNIDADLVSSYFYSLDGVIYAGPVWDYDMTFGNTPRNIDPAAFVAKNTYKAEDLVSVYYGALYANESFYDRMVECYRSDFLPLLNQLTQNGIADLAAEIQSAADMNYLRWQTMYGIIRSWNADAVGTVDGLISYLKNRVSFLNSAWLEGTEYCTVQVKLANVDEYWNFAVRKGDLLETEYLDLENTVWVDKMTGETVDLNQPILSDRILAPQGDPAVQGKSMDLDTLKTYAVVLSTVLLAVFLFCMVCVDISYRRKERRAANEQKQSHVSP